MSNPFEEHIKTPVPGALSGQEYLEKLQREKSARDSVRNSVKVAPPGKRPHCLTCGRDLWLYTWRDPSHPDKLYGTYGDNRFCGLRCGYRYAIHLTRITRK